MILKLVLPIFFVVLILGIGLSQAEAYDGKVKVIIDDNNKIIGDDIVAEIMLVGDIDIQVTGDEETEILEGEPDSDTQLEISIIDTKSDNIVNTTMINPSWNFQENGDDPLWVFTYSIDTSSGLEADTKYDLQVQYDDKMNSHSFSLQLPPEESAMKASQAMNEGKLVMEDDESPPQITDETTEEFPEWVDNIFVWYAEKTVDRSELITALQYLIEVGILKV